MPTNRLTRFNYSCYYNKERRKTMGLAASQARFLGITARKNTCELRSMQIAQEKLSITNQLTQISQNYQNSLDATKLVWDSEYITDGSIYDVSYELLMTPSLLNNYSPQLLTNNKGQIVLDSQYANAIRDIAVGDKVVDGTTETASFEDYQTGGADRTQANFIKFLEGLNAGGILSQSELDSMKAALTLSSSFYDPDNGLGAPIQEKFTTNSMNLNTMKNYINTITDPNSDYVNSLRETYDTAYNADGTQKTITLPDGSTQPMPDTIYDKVAQLGNLLNFKQLSGAGFEYQDKQSDGSMTPVTGATLGEKWANDDSTELTISDSSFNFADLLEKEITLSTDNANEMGQALVEYINELYNVMLQFFAIDPASVDQDYLNFAMDQICKLNGLSWDSTSTPPTAKYPDTATDLGSAISSGAYSTGDPASKHTCVIKNGNNYQVSLSNVAKGIITYFEKAVEGFESGYDVEATGDKKVEDSYYVTRDPEYFYFINNPEALNIDDETQLLLDYYSQMFNQICANGWTENDLVGEEENLKNMLKNGTLFTSTLSEMDGNFYQGPYTSNNFIAEVADEDAIARAEAEYKTKQLQLSAKEEELDIDLQQVDAELSALTTEYDTVKSLISKAVEKGFSTLGGS